MKQSEQDRGSNGISADFSIVLGTWDLSSYRSYSEMFRPLLLDYQQYNIWQATKAVNSELQVSTLTAGLSAVQRQRLHNGSLLSLIVPDARTSFNTHPHSPLFFLRAHHPFTLFLPVTSLPRLFCMPELFCANLVLNLSALLVRAKNGTKTIRSK
jgi:hypothetical protein